MVCRCHPRLIRSTFSRFQRCWVKLQDVNMRAFSSSAASSHGNDRLDPRGTENSKKIQSSSCLPVSLEHEDLKKIKCKQVKGLPIVHHDKYVSKLPLNHRFAMRKFHGVLRYLRIDGVISMSQVVQPEKISAEACGLVHSPDYVDRFFSGHTTRQEQRITGFVWTPCLVDRCRYETGGTLLAAELALERGLACSTGGGTHHAYRDFGSGYCLINDLAVTAGWLLHTGKVERVMVVDLDVHQGDGTASIFESENRVFTFSMHCQNNFPGKKQTSDLDIGLSNGVEDEEYLQILEGHLPWIVDSFRPDLVLYDAGVDPHVRDELGKLCLTDQGLFNRDHYVLDLLALRGIPCATVIGGGYSRNLDQLYRRHTIVHRAASKVWKERSLGGNTSMTFSK